MYWQGVLLVAIIVEAGQERHGGVQGGEGFGSVHLLMSQRRGIRCHVLLDLNLRLHLLSSCLRFIFHLHLDFSDLAANLLVLPHQHLDLLLGYLSSLIYQAEVFVPPLIVAMLGSLHYDRISRMNDH